MRRRGQCPRRGDSNDDGGANLTDAVHVLGYLFLQGATPGCLEAANANDDGEVNLTDAVYLLNYLFLAGPELPAPGNVVCGVDPVASASQLGCICYRSCSQ